MQGIYGGTHSLRQLFEWCKLIQRLDCDGLGRATCFFYRDKESVEDVPQAGINDVTNLLDQDGPVIAVGITCGHQALFVI